MKNLLLLSAILASTLAIPNGYYYQESSSRSSSSSYKNNELQQQTEDESYFSKHGDAEGRTAPKINTYSQHLEYQNPNKQEHGQSTSLGSQNQNAFRHLDNSDRYTGEQALGSDGIVRTVSGNRNQYAYTATYGVSGGDTTPLQGGHYDTQSNLLSLTQRLQNDLSRQLNSAINKQRSYNSYSGHSSSGYVESEFRDLEREIKANLTKELQEELQRQYGTQMSRGSHSYSFKSGQYSPEANYNTQELEDLTTQVENNLMQQLRNQYQSTQSSSSNSYYSSQQAGQGSRAHTTMYRPSYQEAFPLNPEVRPSVPLTDVVSQVQNTADRKLNDALLRLEQQYLSADIAYAAIPDYDAILENLKEELKRNLTTTLQNTLVERYGAQEEHNNYYYTSRNVAAGSRVANYKVDDLDSLKQQVENNLIHKLQNSIIQQRQTYQGMNRQTYSQSQTNHNTAYTNNNPSSPNKVYTSYVVFTPSRRPDTVHTQSSSHNAESSYSYGEQANVGPAYRSSHTPSDNERPIRYGTYQPTSQNTNYASNNYQTSSQNQESQRVEQLGHNYNPTSGHGSYGTRPTQTSQTPQRGPYYSSNTGTVYPSGSSASYPSGSGASYPSSRVYPSGGSAGYPSGSGASYPSSGGASYPSGSGSNYQTSQSNRESSYKIAAGQRESGIVYTPGSNTPQTEYQAELINIRDQVQDDISRQLNNAIQRQRQSTSSYSTSTVSNNQVLSELSEELKRNLTQKIEQALKEHYGRSGVRGGYSFTVTSGGRVNPGNYNREQLTTLTNQLQEDLLRQLREGLAQESYRQSTSHSSSSYEPVISQGTYGQGSNAYRTYSSGSYSKVYSSGQSECCMQADDSTTTSEDVINQHNQKPARGDISPDNKNTRKIEDVNAEKKLVQQEIEEKDVKKQEDNEFVEPEVVPPEAETSTSTLARDKPSVRPGTVKPIRQEQGPQINTQQQTSVSNVNKLTQDLIDFEKHTNQNQQQVEQVDQTDNLDDFDQHTYFGNFDQQTFHNFDQTSGADQQTPNKMIFDEQSQQKPTGITQQTINQFDQTMDQSQQQQFEEESEQTGRITQQNIQNLNLNTTNPLLHSNNGNIQSSSIYQSSYNTPQSQNMNQYSQYNPIIHETDNLSQDHYLTQQTEDLTQQIEDLPQKNEDLVQHTEDLSPQSHNLNYGESVNLQRNIPHRYSGYNPSMVSVNTHLQQQTGDLTQQTEDLTQQTEDLTQQTEDLTQQTEDLTQQTEDLTQQTDDLVQHTEDLTPQSSNLNQKDELRRSFPHIYSGYSPSVAPQNTYLSQISQQTEDIDKDAELLHQNSRNPHGSYHSQSSYQSLNSQSSSSHSSTSESRQLHYGSVNQVPLQTTSNLDQQLPETQFANVVQDVSHQVNHASSSSEQKLTNITEIPTTTTAPGFWKRLGGKISNTYHKAKDSISSVG